MFFILETLTIGHPKKLFMFRKSLPACLTENYVVSVKKRAISFLDLNSLAPKEIDVERLRSASKFIDALTESGGSK